MRGLMVLRIAVGLVAMAVGWGQGQTGAWRPMFDGKSLAEWRETAFTGHGKVTLEHESIVLNAGGPLTGVTWTGAFPKTDYEVQFEGARVSGNDFFAAFTFPVGESFATFVAGGWGGDAVGLSSIDGRDGSDNETSSHFEFEDGLWYGFRVRVTAERITGWINDSEVFDVAIRGRKVDLRPGEIKRSAPVGFASYGTKGAVRKVEFRTLGPG
jgi:hypothetical protein